MAVPDTSLLTPKEAEDLKTLMGVRLAYEKRFWRPLHARMDYWRAMYFLLDIIQQIKPIGYRRFTSNEPRTALDAAMAILTRNEPFWRIPLNEIAGENTEDREHIGKIERTLQGVVHDIDENFSMRQLMPLWKQAAMQALLDGSIWGKFHVTEKALEYRDAPLICDMYDPRNVYPRPDAMGLNYVIVEKPTTVGEFVSLYPEVFGELERTPTFDPTAPAVKLEYWSNDRGDVPGLTGTLGMPMPAGQSYSPATPLTTASGKWLIPPYKHGYSPQQLPVVGVAVNGVNIQQKPLISQLVIARQQQRMQALGVQEYGAFWQTGSDSWVAETGRGLLSAVEEQVPQYNEVIATIFQHFSIGTYGTWIFKTPNAELPEFTPGIEAKIAIRPEEDLKRAEIAPITADAYRIVDILDQERQKGVLSNILQAAMPVNLPSGVFLQQITNAALNALEPYHDGLENFGTRAGTSILAQMQAAGRSLKKFQVAAPASGNLARRQTFFQLEFDPAVDLEKGRRYRPRPVFKPSLPDDLSIRIQAARQALDPRRPILSLMTVLETILQLDDPAEEQNRIWEDIANNDPVIVLEQVAQALDKRGETEMAARIRNNEFQTAFIQEMQFRQATGQTGGLAGVGGTGGTTMSAETGSPAATQHPGTGQGQAPQSEQARQGAFPLGSSGERRGV